MKSERYDVIRRIAGPRAFSPWVFLPVLVILSAGTTLSATISSPKEFAEWNSIAAIALVCSWLFALAGGLLVNAVVRESSVTRFACVLTVYFVTEAGRAVLVAWQARLLDLDPDPNWVYRIVAGGLTGVTLFGIVSFLVNETFEYRKELGELLTANKQLEETVSTTEEDLEVRRVKLLESVRSAVTDSIRTVLSTGGASARDVADDLVRVSEDVVRPLSHSLFPSDTGLPERPDDVRARIDPRSVFNYATYVNPFRPEAVLIFAILLSFGAIVFASTTEVKIGSILLFAFIYGYLWVLRKFVTPALKRLRLWWRVAVLTICYIGLGAIPGALVRGSSPFTNIEHLSYFIYIVVIGLLLLWPLALITGIRVARADVLEEIRQSSERLEWERARLAAHLWGQQNNLALALHKDVQGTLMAAAMKLKLSRDAGKDEAQAIDEIRSTVLQAAEFVMTPRDTPSFAESVADLNARWQGVFRLVIDAGTRSRSSHDNAIRRINADAVCRRIVIDLLSEFVTNAVKHGQATSATVNVSLRHKDLVFLDATNNGRSLAESPGAGLGARMLAAVSVAHGFENVPGGVRVWARIPVV